MTSKLEPLRRRLDCGAAGRDHLRVCSILGMCVTSAVLILASRAEALVIGGFSALRANNVSLHQGTGATIAPTQSGVATAFPSATITSTDTLTPSYLSTVDVLIVTSIRQPATVAFPVTLSAAEQSALFDFVSNGGSALIFTENDSFNVNADAGNESFLDPFGLDSSGTGSSPAYPSSVHNPTVTNPTHPIVDNTFGFGAVTTPLFFAFGSFNNLGPNANELAHIGGPLNAPGIAVIERNALAPGSGAVILFSDTSPFFGNYVNAHNSQLLLSSIAYAAVPEPSTWTLVALGLLAMAPWMRRFRRAGLRDDA